MIDKDSRFTLTYLKLRDDKDYLCLAYMKRIVFCVSNDLTTDQRMQRICRSLSAAKYHVVLAGRKLPDSQPLKQEPFTQHRLNCFFSKGKLFYIEFNIRLLIWLLQQRFDAVCAIDLDTIMPALIATKLKGKLLAHDAHEYFPEVPEVVNRPFTKAIWQAVEKFALPKTNLCYTVSQSIANEFNQQYGITVHVVRNISVLQLSPQTKQEQNVVIYQGALNEGRGLEELIKAASENNSTIWMAGEGDLSAQLRTLVAQNSLQQKVIFYGKLSPGELTALTPKATIGFNVLQPKGKSYYYSLSNKTFDYIHAGIPQLMSDFPEMRLLNEKYQIGIIVKECTPSAISAAINRLLQDQKLYSTLQANCIQAKQELNWQHEEKTLLNIYEHLFR